MNKHSWMAVALSCASLTACTEVESEDVLTDGMYAYFVAIVGNDGTRVAADLNVGGSGANATNVELTGDDVLKATIGDETRTLEKDPVLIDINDPQYSTFFDDVNAPGTEVKIAFERTVDEGAPESSVTLPSEPDASGPDGTPSRAADEIVVTFAAGDADETTRVSISGSCFQGVDQTVDGAGATSVTFAAGSLLEPEPEEGEDPPEPATCEATITVRRTRSGEVDKAFGEGGAFEAIREQTLTFDSAP